MSATVTALPHIDDLDPETPIFTIDGESHLATCPTLHILTEDIGTCPVETVETATGWWCADCVDVSERIDKYAGINLGLSGKALEANVQRSTAKKVAKPRNLASERQMAFIESLMAERGLGDVSPADYFFNSANDLVNRDGSLTKKEASMVIDRLMQIAKTVLVGATEDDDVAVADVIYDADAITVAAAARTATKFTPDEMTAELIVFATDWAKAYTGSFEFMADMRAAAVKGPLSPGQAKGVMNCYLAGIRRGEVAVAAKGEAATVAPAGDPEEGIYRVGDDIVKVQHGRQTGGWYCKVLVGFTEKVLADDGTIAEYGDLSWEYIGRKVRPTAADRLPQDEARKYGQVTGRCMDCGRKLTDETSIEQGIGPVCILK